MVICVEQGADLHLAQLMPLPLTVSCFSKIQIGSTFLIRAHLGSPGKRAVKRMCVCVCIGNPDKLLKNADARAKCIVMHPGLRAALSDTTIHQSVCASPRHAAALGYRPSHRHRAALNYRHAGCLQLSPVPICRRT